MAEALYRKYRSKSLDEVVGQQHITDTLARALKSGQFSHAYLFTGPRGTGKTSVARIVAHSVNNLPYNDKTAHLDIIEIDAASNRRIDDIRDLREKVHVAPVSAPYKVYIIDEVHMLTGDSFNALLKTLEEPPAHAIFILATTEAHKLPATIVSRAQRFHFRPVPASAVAEHLASIAKSEGITIEPAALELLAEHGEGSFRDSISLLDQLNALTGGNITLKAAEQVIGVSPHSAIEAIVGHLLNGETAKLQELLGEQLEERGVNAQIITGQLIKALKNNAHDNPQLYALIDQLLEVPKSSQPSLKLMVLLLKFAAKADSTSATKTTSAAGVHQPARHTVSKTPKEVAGHQSSATRKKEPKHDDEPHPTNQQPFDQQAWQKVVASLKTANPPLYSVLTKAEPKLTGDELQLRFAYKLHQKKLDDSKYRTQLTKAIASLGYEVPKISGMVRRDATPATPSTDTAADTTTKGVLDMMGGGEIVDA